MVLEERTLWQQTQRAAMQFSVIAGEDTWQRTRGSGHVAADTRHVTRDCAGVCFMVGLAFGLMIVVEESLSKLWAVVER